MMIAPDKIPMAVSAFIDNELMPKAQPYTWQKGALFVGALLAVEKITAMMQHPATAEVLKLYGILTPDGAIDTVKGEEMAKEFIKGAGGSINFMGIVFSDADAAKFFNIARSL